MASVVTLIQSTKLSDVAQYIYAAPAPADARLIFLAGSCPLDTTGEVVGEGDYALQAQQCIRNVRTALVDAGATLEDVISTRVLVASGDRRDLMTAWQVVREAFGDHDAPSTLLGLTVLGYEHQLVEIEAVTAVRELLMQDDRRQDCSRQASGRMRRPRRRH
jgi:enamine deaminase RidA (YjgF/YER057c/UK114 family)